MVDVFIGLVILSTLGQFIVDRIKSVVPVKTVRGVELAPIYSLVIGLLLGVLCQIDLLAYLGFPSYPVVGWVLSGLAISGGSAGIHELFAKLRAARND